MLNFPVFLNLQNLSSTHISEIQYSILSLNFIFAISKRPLFRQLTAPVENDLNISHLTAIPTKENLRHLIIANVNISILV